MQNNFPETSSNNSRQKEKIKKKSRNTFLSNLDPIWYIGAGLASLAFSLKLFTDATGDGPIIVAGFAALLIAISALFVGGFMMYSRDEDSEEQGDGGELKHKLIPIALISISFLAFITGEVNTASNIGNGAGIFAQKAGTDFQHKSLVEGANVTITEAPTEITIGLSPGASSGTTSTFEEDDVQVGDADIITANFGLGFDLSEAPNTKITVDVDPTEFTLTDDSIFLGAVSNLAVATSIVDCDDTGGNHLNYDTTTNVFSCGTSGAGSDTVDIEEDNISEQVDADTIDFSTGFDVNCIAGECDVTVNLGDTISGSEIIDGDVDISTDTNLTASSGITLTGDNLTNDLGTSIETAEIANDTILEIDLDVTNTPTDNFILTSDTTSGGFTWVDGSTIADGVGYDEVLDEASGLTQRAQINFTGAGVSCVDNAGATRTDCTIAGGAADTIDIEEDNILEQADASELDFSTGFDVVCVAGECDVTVNLGDSIVTAEITDDNILEVDLDVTNTPTDNFILSFDLASGGFTWVVDNTIADTDTHVDIEEDNISEQVDAATIDFGAQFNVACAASECDITVDTITTTEITDDNILEIDLDITNAPTDNFILTSDTASGGFTWVDPTTIADGVGYDEILDEASGLTQRSQVNFTGAGIACVDNPGATRTDCTVAGGAADTIDIEEDNILEQADASELDFSTGFDVNCVAGECDVTVNLGDSIVTAEITDDNILEIDLDITNGPTDNFFLTADTASGGFTWVADPDTDTHIDIEEDNISEATNISILDFGGEFNVVCSAGECDITLDAVDISDDTNLIGGTGITLTDDTLSADLGTDIITSEIVDDTILPIDLDAIDTEADEECVTFETTGAAFEFQACDAVTTWQFGKTLLEPVDADSYLIEKLQNAITITDVHCIVDPADTTESVVIDIQETDSSGDTGVSFDTTITCDNDGAEDDGAISNAIFDAGDYILWDIGTVTGTVSAVTVTIYYTIN